MKTLKVILTDSRDGEPSSQEFPPQGTNTLNISEQDRIDADVILWYDSTRHLPPPNAGVVYVLKNRFGETGVVELRGFVPQELLDEGHPFPR